jgi:biopolymer transport protein ExbD
MRFACMVIVLLVACGDDGSGADALFGKRESKREATEAEHLEAQRREIEMERRRMLEEQRSGLRVELPKGASQEIDPSVMSLVIDVTEDGALFVQGKRLDETQLDNVFRAAFTREPATQVVIRAARGTSHGIVVNVMEKAKAAGLRRLAIGTTPAPP